MIPTQPYESLPGNHQSVLMSPLQLTPEMGAELAYTEVEASTTAVTHTLNAATRLVEIQVDDYAVRVRRHITGDTSACTASNAMGRVKVGDTRHYGVSADATALSLLALGTTNVVIIEY